MLTASVNLLDGKLDCVISGQQLILEEVVSLRHDVRAGVQSVHNHLLAMRNTQFRQKLSQLEETYCEVLRRVGRC